MGKLVVTEFVSIDGVFEDPGGAEDFEHGGWTFEYDRGEDGNKFKMDELRRRTSAPRASDLRGLRRGLADTRREFADKLNTDPKSSSRIRSRIRSGRTRRSSPAMSSAG